MFAGLTKERVISVVSSAQGQNNVQHLEWRSVGYIELPTEVNSHVTL